MILLTATTDTLKLTTAGTGTVDVVVAFVDTTATSITEGKQVTQITTATTTTIVSAPAASTTRIVKTLTISRVSGSGQLTVLDDASGTQRRIATKHTRSGDTWAYMDAKGWELLASSTPTNPRPRVTIPFMKACTAADSANFWYCSAKDSGFPGAWSPGTPGLAGRATDGTASGDAGCLPVPAPSIGAQYLTSLTVNYAGSANYFQLIDILWCNSGLVVTTTTAQTINSVTLPARDVNRSTNGEGCMIGLLFVAAATNAAQISNSTISYTNSAGTAGRTATLTAIAGALIPATPVIGTWVWYLLQAGDTGVQSIQTASLGTSLVTGTVSLCIARVLADASSVAANIGNTVYFGDGIQLSPGVAPFLILESSAGTAGTLSGSITCEDR